MQAATALAALSGGEAAVHGFGPGGVNNSTLPGGELNFVRHESPQFLPSWTLRYSWWRWYQGHYQLECDRRLGRWAARQIERLQPERCYVFTQVGLEVLRWARRHSIPTVLDNPNGHISHYRAVRAEETKRWYGRRLLGHPTEAMVERVEEEYRLADRIRVSSEWAKQSMVSGGVPAEKIRVVAQPLNLQRFQPRHREAPGDGPLRICYVGSLDVAKGFQYLLRAMRTLDQEVSLEIVGATGSRPAKNLFERERRGITITSAPGDPVPAYQRAEVFVLPSLHDGFGFVVAEAMACGLPVIVTENCGSAGWIRNGQTGWIIAPGQVNALVEALSEALRRRPDLQAMGESARTDVERRADPVCLKNLREWVFQEL
jgi:glycosyltransferase involved in cell wall biosynthesis